MPITIDLADLAEFKFRKYLIDTVHCLLHMYFNGCKSTENTQCKSLGVFPIPIRILG